MKNRVLEIVYDRFADWAGKEKFFCGAGCATCCTRNVTVTSLEARSILSHIFTTGSLHPFIQKLNNLSKISGPKKTTNGYVQACLKQNSFQQENTKVNEKCPFLDENLCTIYPVRPFGCRSFASETLCKPGTPAVIPDHYFYGSMIATQIIEHLDQSHSWGIMSEVLTALCSSPRATTQTSAIHIHKERCDTAQSTLLRSSPLPGFIIPKQYSAKIEPLLHSLFSTTVGPKTVEQILNGN